MRLRTFNAPDMPTAMQQVREALGDDAVILSSQMHRGKGVSVTAAVEQEESSELRGTSYEKKEENNPLATRNSQLATEHIRFEVQETLRFHNIPELFIAKIMNADRDAWKKDARHSLEKLLAAYFTFEPLHLERGHTLMLVGPPGIGKTLTIARIAARLTMDKRPVFVVTTDNKRAGGIEQLQAFTNILGQPLKVATSHTALAQYLKSLSKQSHVLIDTAGCNPYDKEELAELAAFAAQENIEPVLAMAAGGDSLEAIDTVETFMQLPIKRLLVTRADTARRFGGIVAAAAAHGLSFCNASSSSSITDHLLPIDESLLARLLLKYKNINA